MNWRTFLTALSPHVALNKPASDNALSEAEAALGVRLPGELRLLLEQSNGVSGEYELALVWPIERIVADNLDFRSNTQLAGLYMPFASLLFFADAGNGDQFAFPIVQGAINRPDIFAWDHENDSRRWVAPALQTYLEWWLSGKLKL
jgi:hypothetical protein